MGATFGKIRKAIGWATGDRRQEAKGLAEVDTDGSPTEAEIDEKEAEVREGWKDTVELPSQPPDKERNGG